MGSTVVGQEAPTSRPSLKRLPRTSSRQRKRAPLHRERSHLRGQDRGLPGATRLGKRILGPIAFTSKYPGIGVGSSSGRGRQKDRDHCEAAAGRPAGCLHVGSPAGHALTWSDDVSTVTGWLGTAAFLEQFRRLSARYIASLCRRAHLPKPKLVAQPQPAYRTA
jgi:hypothetical protein